MNDNFVVGCVLMASGYGARFGDNKLLAEFRGKTLIRWALEAVPADRLAGVAVVTQYEAVAAQARAFGFTVLQNAHPEIGISESIRLGTAALSGRCDGLIYLVADQPLLRRQTVERLVEAFCQSPSRIVVPVAGERRGNPCIFPAACFPALQTLEGDRGGSQVIRRCPERVLSVEVPPEELLDVDRAETLLKLEEAAPS